MPLVTESYLLDRKLTLQASTGEPLTVQAGEIALTKADDEVTECRLTFKVSSELYQRVETEGLFNLKPEVRRQSLPEGFLPEVDIEIEARLSADLLPHLTEQVRTAQAAADYLLELNQNQTQDPLLFTESWYGLYVRQPVALPPGLEGELKPAYSKAWVDSEMSEMDEQTDSPGPIFEVIVKFFTEKGWTFSTSQEEAIVHIDFEGKNGKWHCIARAIEEQEQCVFYSIFPVPVPEEKRLALAEFLSRANFGMVIGNFEIDLDDGETRYKTSIDVEGDRLSSVLMRQLVTANVSMMARYLPGMLKVIFDDISPEEAIAQIEGQPE